MSNWTVALVAFIVIGNLVNVARIGQPREPTTPGEACVSLGFAAFMIYAAIH